MGCHNSRRLAARSDQRRRSRDSTPEKDRGRPLMDETPPKQAKHSVVLVVEEEDDGEEDDKGEESGKHDPSEGETEGKSEQKAGDLARAASAPDPLFLPGPKGGNALVHPKSEDASARKETKIPRKETKTPRKETKVPPMGLCKNAGTAAGGRWSEPSASSFKVRSGTYLQNRRKTNSEDVLFRLVHLDIFQTKEGCVSHIADAKSSWYSQFKHLLPQQHFALIINMQVRSLNCHIVSYHVLDKGLESVEHKGLRDMLKHMATNPGSQWCNSRLKMIPRIVEAPFIVRMAVSSRPVLIGTKVQCKYYRGPTYTEIDCNVDSSSVSATAVRLAHKWSECIVIDIVWLLEAKDAKQLPERILAGIRLDKVAFAKAQRFRAKTFTEEKTRTINSLPTSPVFCPAAPLATRESGVAASAPSLSPVMTPRVRPPSWEEGKGTPTKRLDSNIDYSSVEEWLREVGLLEGRNKKRLSIPELREVMAKREKEIEKMEESGRSSPYIIDKRKAFVTWEMADNKMVTSRAGTLLSTQTRGGRSSRAQSDLPRRSSTKAVTDINSQKRIRRASSRNSMRIRSESEYRGYIGKRLSPMKGVARRLSIT
mmetsp:Transcript_27700/g.53900  ORF Transcript_27700/g.53900 Transcript_27700/m.53900 type:complete len:596 (-) Transcript_27700:316-2103(-)